MKKPFNQELVMTKEDNENFKRSTKFRFYDKDYVDNDVKGKDHCHIFGKQTGSGYKDSNINIKLNHKIPVVFPNLKIMISIYYARTRQIRS